jgi:UDP-glucose 4-epimerase
MKRAKLADFSPEQIRFLTYGRGVDTTRMRDQFGFHPNYTTAQAFSAFVDARSRNGVLDRDRVGSVEQMLVGALRRTGSDG